VVLKLTRRGVSVLPYVSVFLRSLCDEGQFIFSVRKRRIWQEGAKNMLKAKVLPDGGSAKLFGARNQCSNLVYHLSECIILLPNKINLSEIQL
jgi:hypothetical protein